MTNGIMYDGRRYEKGRGVFVGKFDEVDLESGRDKLEVKKMQQATGLQYTNEKLVKKNGVPVGIKIWVCSMEDFKI